MIDFLYQTGILLLNILIFLKIPGFFVQNFRFFQKFLKFQILSVFLLRLSNSRFPGKEATQYLSGKSKKKIEVEISFFSCNFFFSKFFFNSLFLLKKNTSETYVQI